MMRNKKNIIIIVLLVVVACLSIIIIKNHINKNNLSSTINDTETTKEINYSKYLKFSNVSINRDQVFPKNGEVDGEVTNNYTEALDGYIEVTFYDDDGKIIKDWTSTLPSDLGAGETKTFSVPINMYKYAKYKIEANTVSVK
ncbi:hypothetical protein AGR56_13865 [Clostridium sp. DMHC 10]|uniref:FxLYD domain-containing protein n=1 Tax=Clostridium sp. DMHC 10 TaxID=747377 RepID=UPI00069D5BB2|nr:FxLYD domain-containing protein [Clostridium sp. DMHC 10]KOF57465.1 hypothetical protein AGR56_13865 [Clostridium sp. DMHC 10]